MRFKDSSKDELVTSLVMGELEEMIELMLKLGRGELAGDAATAGGRLVTLRQEGPHSDTSYPAVICRWSVEDCLSLFETSASRAGVSFYQTEELLVRNPEMEFEENLITGRFEAWKGIKVRTENPMEDFLDLLSHKLAHHGMFMEWEEGEFGTAVVFALPIPRIRKEGKRG